MKTLLLPSTVFLLVLPIIAPAVQTVTPSRVIAAVTPRAGATASPVNVTSPRPVAVKTPQSNTTSATVVVPSVAAPPSPATTTTTTTRPVTLTLSPQSSNVLLSSATDPKMTNDSSVCSNCPCSSSNNSPGKNDKSPADVDLNQFLQRWTSDDEQSMTTNFTDSSEIASDSRDWRSGDLEKRNLRLLKQSLFTDCTFLVGANDSAKEFAAHRVFLVRSSPVFEALFNSTQTNQRIRIKNISANTFQDVLNFVYTGEACLSSFEQACDALQAAALLQIADLTRHARARLWADLYPGNVWHGYQCASAAGDVALEEAAMQIIQSRTEEAVRDPTFANISRPTLIAFLKRDDLNMTSEAKLYEASLRWAMNEVARRGLTPEPEALRDALGPALSLIRFLQFSPSEFASMQSASKVLTYSESLAIIFNLNSPNVMALPANLSSSNVSRSNPTINTHFYVHASTRYPSSCKLRAEKYVNTFDLYSVQPVRLDRNLKLKGIEIPTQINCSGDGYFASNGSSSNRMTYVDDVTVHVLNQTEVMHSTRFTGLVNCSSLVKIKFTEIVSLPYKEATKNNYKIKIIFHVSGRYPVSWFDEIYRNGPRPRQDSMDGCTAYFWYFKTNEYVYAMISDGY